MKQLPRVNYCCQWYLTPKQYRRRHHVRNLTTNGTSATLAIDSFTTDRFFRWGGSEAPGTKTLRGQPSGVLCTLLYYYTYVTILWRICSKIVGGRGLFFYSLFEVWGSVTGVGIFFKVWGATGGFRLFSTHKMDHAHQATLRLTCCDRNDLGNRYVDHGGNFWWLSP